MMRMVCIEPTFVDWREKARSALAARLAPDEIAWRERGSLQTEMFPAVELPASEPSGERVPAQFITLAKGAALNANPERWALLYRVLWRIIHGEPNLLKISVDDDVQRLLRMRKEVAREIHKMRAFVRFRKVEESGWFVAWFEPQHHVVEANAPFFIDRFAGMRWSILTPLRCAHWDGTHLRLTEGVPQSEAPGADTVENLWRTYYAGIFNPARVKVAAMQSEMPRRYWKNLPEAATIQTLLREAPARVEAMIEAGRDKRVEEEWLTPDIPATADLEKLAAAASKCTACPLYRNATQVVFGEGPDDARIMLVGEQPGDQEDREGRPFVGPAGKLLDRALVAAGIDRERCYVTNTVKHFKWIPRGKRRLHQKPSARDIASCSHWLEAEVARVQPGLLICLGATAGQFVLGPTARVTRDRGVIRPSRLCAKTLLTIHPSALLRMGDDAEKAEAFDAFVKDLKAGARAC